MLAKFKSLGLGIRIIVVTLVILVTVVAVNNYVFVAGYKKDAEKAMVEKAAAFTAVADEAKNHTADLNKRGAFDVKTLLDELKKDREAGRPYTESKVFGTIPVVAGWKAAEKAAEREKINFRVSSFEARNDRNEPKPGSFEEKLLRELTNQVKAGGSEIAYAFDKQTNQLHYLRAIRLTADCMLCHGKPGNEFDTDKDGKDPLGFQMEGWDVGYMHGAYHVIMPMDTVDASVAGFVSNGLLWTVPLVLGAVALFVWLLRVMFSKPVTLLIDRIKDIAQGEGDLTQRIQVNSEDEIGQLGKWFNTFVAKIHDVIYDTAGTAREVASAATQIAASSEEMAAGMTEQSKQVTQISAAIEEMSASVVEVAKKSGDAANNASNSGKVAQEGGTVVEQTIQGMQAINEAVNASAASVTELGKRGAQIGQIIEVINDIADQTNLLALNAAIEAARAGEHGRGFAVVADEVRKLADRTTKATEEIGESIKAIQTETDGAVQRMSVGTEQVKKGVERATEAGASLRKIVASAQEVASMIQSIAAAAEEQSAASEQVSKNVETISSVTKQASEGAGQAASAAAQLSSKAEQLQQLVGQFKLASSRAA
jgi:methyl-accepting chemotaxis protein